MTRGLRKDFRRELGSSFSRFVSITLIVLLGTAFFSGLRASKPAMLAAADLQYDRENLMDLRVAGTLGVTEGDVQALKELEGAADAEGVYEQNFLCAAADAETVVKVLSLTDRINLVRVTGGRFPEKYNECIADPEFLKETGYQLGDTVRLSTGTDEALSRYLAADEFLIVGEGATSYYLDKDRGSAPIGNGTVGGFLVLPKEAFTLPCFTQIFVTAKGAAPLQCGSSDYTDLVKGLQKRVEAIASKRCNVRYAEYQVETERRIQEVRIKYEREKESAMDQLGASYQKLIDAQAMIEDGKAELESKKMDIAASQAVLSGRAQNLGEISKKVEAAKQKIPALEQECRDLEVRMNETSDEIERMQQELKNKSGEMTQEEFLKANQELMSAKSTLQNYKNRLNQMTAAIEAAKKQIALFETFVKNGDRVIEEARQKIELAPEVLAEAEKYLEDAQIELERRTEDYEMAQNDLVDELAAAEEKLEKSEAKIRNVAKPIWYVLDRSSIPSYTGFQNDAAGLGSIGAVFPAIFFLVAALVSLTTMTRMVEEERTQIGILKALGYGKNAVAAKYVLYAFVSTLLGGLLGIALGESVIPHLAIRSYRLVYAYLRYSLAPFDVSSAALALSLALLCTTGAAWAACRRSLRESPAALMRPEAPKSGRRIWLEKSGFFWKRLNFAQKAACRNLFRYKKRLSMTIFGVAGCMALLLVGFGLNDSIGAMAQGQFHGVWRYQGTVGIDETCSRAEKRQLLSELGGMPGVEEFLQTSRSLTWAVSPAGEENAFVIVPQDTTRLPDYVRLAPRGGQEESVLGDGVLVTEKLARILGVSAGDVLRFKSEETGAPTEPVKISGIVENYFYHFVYMTPNLYRQIFGEEPQLNSILLKTDGSENDGFLAKSILKLAGANSVLMNSALEKTIDGVMRSMLIIVFILIFSAGLLAFVVLYNLNSINIAERRRELATLKVLGFYDGELAAYVYRENAALTLIGIFFGVLLGIVLHAYVMQTIETDIIMFGPRIGPLSYLFSILLTAGFSALVNWAMFYRLRRIDMVESLKSTE